LSVNAASAQWESLESLPSTAVVRHHPTAFALGGTGYLMGGAESNSNALKDFYSYDPLTDTWTQKTDFPGQPRGFAYAVDSDTKGYVGFGLDFDEGTSIEEYLKDLWEYDPLTDTWTELTPLPGSARIHPAMVELDGKIYVGLGGSALGDLGDWWVYDIGNDTWTEKATFPGDDRHHPYYFEVGGYVYVGMGHSGPNIYNDFYKYDPQLDSWTQLNNLPSQGRVAGTQFTYDGKGYILSGQGETHQNLPTGEFWEYTPGTDSWTALTAHPGGGRWAPGSFVISGGVYLMCGEANTGLKRDLMRYQIEGFSSLEKDANFDQSAIYPNPSNGEVKFLGVNVSADLTITDLKGTKVWSGKVSPDQSVDLNSLKTGIYLCTLVEDGVTRREKLVLKRT
jgi:N-acetylneuraminic acid mutarotase